MSKEIIINYLPEEIRVAILEDKKLTEIFYERKAEKSPIGNIILGRVLKVLPGMDAAFIGIGAAKAAFLYVDDILVNPSSTALLGNNGAIKPLKPTEIPPTQSTDIQPNSRKINELIESGQSILLQVSKAPINSKGSRVTGHLSIPARNLVLIPFSSNVAVSRKITNERERSRLKRTIRNIKPNDMGVIVRTVAKNRSEEEFKNDIEYTLSIWQKIKSKLQKLTPPSILFEDLNLTFRMMRDNLSQSVTRVVIDNEQEFERLQTYLTKFMPQYAGLLTRFTKSQNIFDAYGIHTEIDRALKRKVPLQSGGYLIFDQAEALTAIDVNTGSYIGSDNHQDTILQTNQEAITELVHQIKLRDIGGIIIIDFIDMKSGSHKEQIYKILKTELKKDKTRTRILRISEIGLVEMTRKRNHANLSNFLCMGCPYCDATGKIKSLTTIFHEIYQDVERLAYTKDCPKSLLIHVHPDLIDFFKQQNKTFQAMEGMFTGNIRIQPNPALQIEQYEILELFSPKEIKEMGVKNQVRLK